VITLFAEFCLSHMVFLPSRFAYVEFAEPEFVDAAMALDNSLFRGRLIKVRVSVHRIKLCVLSLASRLRRNEQTSPDSTGVVGVAGATGVATGVVTAEEEEVTSHTVLAEGAL
jgi:hypothetical protein